MNPLLKFRLIHRLVIGFSVIVLLFIGISAFGVFQVDTIKTSLGNINDKNSVLQRYAINFRGSVHDRAIALRDVILVDNDEELNQAIDDINKLDGFYQESAVKMDEAFADPEGVDPTALEILNRIKQTEVETQPNILRTIELVRSGDKEAGYAMLMDEARPQFTQWLGVVNEFIDYMEENNKQETAIARGVANGFASLSIGTTVVSLAVGFLVALWIIPCIRKLNTLTKVMLRLAEGELACEIPVVRGKNEVRDVADALKVFKEHAIQSDREAALKAENAKRLTDINRAFEEDSDSIVGQLMQSVNEMQNASQSICSSAEQAHSQCENATTHADSTSANVQSVAAATKELSDSVQEISGTLSGTAGSAQSCSQSARITQEKLQELQSSVAEIDSVVQSIVDVAEQTNLLALNATIEAARAGESGKGFAVVASEVKSLASDTHQMTDAITKKIEGIKNSANETVTSVNVIINKIEDVGVQTQSVSEAVGEQSASTLAISQNINSAAEGSSEVSSSVSVVQQAANASVEVSSRLKVISDELNDNSVALGKAIRRFVSDARDVYVGSND